MFYMLEENEHNPSTAKRLTELHDSPRTGSKLLAFRAHVKADVLILPHIKDGKKAIKQIINRFNAPSSKKRAKRHRKKGSSSSDRIRPWDCRHLWRTSDTDSLTIKELRKVKINGISVNITFRLLQPRLDIGNGVLTNNRPTSRWSKCVE